MLALETLQSNIVGSSHILVNILALEILPDNTVIPRNTPIPASNTRLFTTVSEDQKGRTRNVCNEFGYESVALIPIRLGERILGLIHVADRREDAVPLELVETLRSRHQSLPVLLMTAQGNEKVAVSASPEQLAGLRERLLEEPLVLQPVELIELRMGGLVTIRLEDGAVREEVLDLIERLNASGLVRYATPMFTAPSCRSILTDEFITKLMPLDHVDVNNIIAIHTIPIVAVLASAGANPAL